MVQGIAQILVCILHAITASACNMPWVAEESGEWRDGGRTPPDLPVVCLRRWQNKQRQHSVNVWLDLWRRGRQHVPIPTR
jgi:hypothetical protein